MLHFRSPCAKGTREKVFVMGHNCILNNYNTKKEGKRREGNMKGLSKNHTVNHGRARIKPEFLGSDSVIPAIEYAASQCIT